MNEIYAAFVRDVARGRRVSVERTDKEFGQGLVFGAVNAVRRGMADRVGRLEDVMAQVKHVTRDRLRAK